MVWAACPVSYFDPLLVPETLQKGPCAKGCEDARFGGFRRSRRRQ